MPAVLFLLPVPGASAAKQKDAPSFVLLILAFCLYDEEKAIELDAPNNGDRKADRPGSICNPYGEGHHSSSHTQNGSLRFQRHGFLFHELCQVFFI